MFKGAIDLAIVRLGSCEVVRFCGRQLLPRTIEC